MIVKFAPSRHSFRELANYLLHDVQAKTAERLAWTHTLNLANDHVGCAVDEMLMTFRHRDLLKAEAGVRLGGARMEKPVRHFMLSWHVDENPSREEMIEATQSLLRHLAADRHQAILFCHTDRAHRHVHVMLNAVDPERGTALKQSYSFRRAQAWALGYEQEKGVIRCPERLKPVAEREPSPPRPLWQELQVIQDVRSAPDAAQDELEPHGPRGVEGRLWRTQEWHRLKTDQRQAREAFFQSGKAAYRDLRKLVYREVREQYRREWARYFSLKKSALTPDQLGMVRAKLVERQTATLRKRCEIEARDMREARDALYRQLLDRQKDERAALTVRQEQGQISRHLWSPSVEPAPSPEGKPRDDAAAIQQRARSANEAYLRWTERGSLAAQQRSAMRWLDRAKNRLERLGTKEIPPRDRLAAAAERLSANKEPGQKRGASRGVAVEPDG